MRGALSLCWFVFDRMLTVLLALSIIVLLKVGFAFAAAAFG
jgi:hypothetical protein